MTGGDSICEWLTFDEFHYERARAVRPFQPMNGCSVGMAECRKDFGLALKPSEPIRICSERLGQDPY